MRSRQQQHIVLRVIEVENKYCSICFPVTGEHQLLVNRAYQELMNDVDPLAAAEFFEVRK